MQAVERSEKLAYEYGNQEIEQEHLLYSLLTLEDSLILKLIEKMEIHKEHFLNRSEQALNKRVKVQGGQIYVGKDLNKVLISAEDEAKQMGDEYVSVEHLFLAMMKYPNKELKEVFREYGINRERFLQALSTVRGNQRVTSDNPEATYDTLENLKLRYDTALNCSDKIVGLSIATRPDCINEDIVNISSNIIIYSISDIIIITKPDIKTKFINNYM